MPHSSEIFDALISPITDENIKEAVNLLHQYMQNSVASANTTKEDAHNLLNSMLAYVNTCLSKVTDSQFLAIYEHDLANTMLNKEDNNSNPFAITYLDMLDSLPLSVLDGAKHYLKDQILGNMAEIYVAGLHYHLQSFLKTSAAFIKETITNGQETTRA